MYLFCREIHLNLPKLVLHFSHDLLSSEFEAVDEAKMGFKAGNSLNKKVTYLRISVNTSHEEHQRTCYHHYQQW